MPPPSGHLGSCGPGRNRPLFPCFRGAPCWAMLALLEDGREGDGDGEEGGCSTGGGARDRGRMLARLRQLIR